MRFAGINWAAVLVAALVFFALGYLIHMQLVDLAAWDAAKRTDQAQLSETRMALGAILPLATATGMAVLFRWADVRGAGNGLKWGAAIALASALPAVWYDWFYGTVPAWVFVVDSAHQLLGHAVTGAILARWR